MCQTVFFKILRNKTFVYIPGYVVPKNNSGVRETNAPQVCVRGKEHRIIAVQKHPKTLNVQIDIRSRFC